MNRGYFTVGNSDNPRDEDFTASLFDRVESERDGDESADEGRDDTEEYPRERGEEDFEQYSEYDDEA